MYHFVQNKMLNKYNPIKIIFTELLMIKQFKQLVFWFFDDKFFLQRMLLGLKYTKFN